MKNTKRNAAESLEQQLSLSSNGQGNSSSNFALAEMNKQILNINKKIMQRVEKTQPSKDQEEKNYEKDKQDQLTLPVDNDINLLNVNGDTEEDEDYSEQDTTQIVECSASKQALQETMKKEDLNLASMIPEALPIFNLRTQGNVLEPEIKYKINRLNKNKRNDALQGEDSSMNKRNACKHSKVKDYQCQECMNYIPMFRSVFDTGNVSTFLNIKYINEFQDQVSNNNMGQLKGKAILIYENYKPKNTQEMREYILYTIDKSLKQYKKQGALTKSMLKQLGQIGNYKHLSSELKNYLYVRKQREYNVLSNDGANKQNEGQDQAKQENQFNSVGPHCLLFDSFFECGNLEKAEYVSPTEYNLYLNVDTNTKGHQQWFYFKVKNTFKDKKYTFNIRNFTKPFTLYRSGMKIMMKSKKHQEESEGVGPQEGEDLDLEQTKENDGWVPAGEDIQYWKTDIQRSGWRIPGPINMDDEEDDDQILDDINGIDGGAGLQNAAGLQDSVKKRASKISAQINPTSSNQNNSNQKRRRRYFYCLTFQVEFDYDDDVVYFAYSTPYSYSKTYLEILKFEQQLIGQDAYDPSKVIENNESFFERSILTKDVIYERKMLCKSISGLPIPKISITARKNRGLEFKKRQAIAITSRVHPGETNSNFVFDGFLRFLSSQEGINQLLENYIFKLVPTLNPDGNVCGNYRSSLAGVDLNRQWILPNRELHPSVFHFKEILSQISKDRQILVYCDLHCHSKKKNSFIYGCNTAANGGFTSWTKVRLLPRILARQTALFNLKDCRFRIDPSKLGTARVIVWKEFAVTNSFTLENSFYGYSFGVGKETNLFKPDDYMQIGESLARSIIQYRLLLKQIEKELALTNGWLKPKLLLEVTGTPAAEKIATEQAKKLKEEKRNRQIEEYRKNLGLEDYNADQNQVSQITNNQKINDQSPLLTTNKVSEEKTRNVNRARTMGLQTMTNKTQTQDPEYLKKQFTLNSENIEDIKNQTKRQAASKDDTLRHIDNKDSDQSSQNQMLVVNQRVKQKRSQFDNFEKECPSREMKIEKLQSFIKQCIQSKESESIERDQQNQNIVFPDIMMKTQTIQINQTSKTQAQITPQRSPSGKIKSQVKGQLNLDNLRNSSPDSTFALTRGRSKSMMLEDWRQLFNKTELEQVFDQIQQGEDPNEGEKNLSDADNGSESNASEDNLDIRELYKEVYMREHVMEKEILNLQRAEKIAIKELKKLINEGERKGNNISKDIKQATEIKIMDQQDMKNAQQENSKESITQNLES